MPNYILGVPKMKKHDSSGQAGTKNQEIEITPEMIEAGVNELGFYRDGDLSEDVVIAIYMAMARAARRLDNDHVPTVL